MKIYKGEKLIEQGKEIHLFYRTNLRQSEQVHTHDFIEIVYIVSGSVLQEVDGVSYHMKRGDIAFLNYGCTHAFTPQDSFSYINICFSPELLGDAIITPQNAFSLLSLTTFNELRGNSNGGKISFSDEESSHIEEILFSMLREYEGKNAGWYTVTEHYLGILLTHMLRHTELSLPESDDLTMWQELTAFIAENLSSHLDLSTLAGKCFYHPSYFSRIFKERFGCSPIEYITRRRLDAAVKLLEESTLTVDEISNRCGFSDRRNFYHAFSKHLACTPSEYRAAKSKK